MRVLVTGGVRSGKSGHAESLFAPEDPVTYVAPGPQHDDADWAERIAAHKARRPRAWKTVEGQNLSEVLDQGGPVLIDCLGTWLTAELDTRMLWDEPVPKVAESIDAALDAVTTRLITMENVVLVTNEVGLGVVPSHRSGRMFRDLLGTVNQRVAQVCDEVHLVVAGRVLIL